MRTFGSLFLSHIAASIGLHVDLLIDPKERRIGNSNVEPKPTPDCTQTKCRPRPNQWVQRSISPFCSLGLTRRSDTGDPLRWRSLTHIFGSSIQPRIFTTHNLLKILRRGIRGFSDRDCTQKNALRQRAFQGGVTEEKLLVTGCITPPWNDLKLSDIIFRQGRGKRINLRPRRKKLSVSHSLASKTKNCQIMSLETLSMGIWIVMDFASLQEEFSYAYVHAVAAAAGFSFQVGTRMEDLGGVDAKITCPGILGTKRSLKIELQVKCCLQESIIKKDSINYPLEVGAYNLLRHEGSISPFYLVVVIVPREMEDWACQTEESLVLQKCGYWKSLRGSPPTTNKTKKTVVIPRKQQFGPEVLKHLMIQAGGEN